MRVLFAGPSLFGTRPDLGGIEVRPPAAQGDVTLAVIEGATSIGLIDGLFGTTAAVWHKELLFALASGVRVLGAASMGALRAAECAPFGMQPIGEIAERYARGELDDDAAVAQLHAPVELGSMPLTEALVDVEATILGLRQGKLVTIDEAAGLIASAAGLFFGDRTIEAIVKSATGIDEHRRVELGRIYRDHRVFAKRRDALLLVDILKNLPNKRVAAVGEWSFARTPEWRRTLGRLTASPHSSPTEPFSHAGITLH